MSSDVQIWFSAAQLARLGAAKVIHGMPRTERNAREVARRLEWQHRSVECAGGKAGMRIEFQPPQDVLASVHAFLLTRPRFFDELKTSAARHRSGSSAAVHEAEQRGVQYEVPPARHRQESDTAITLLATLAGLATSSATWLPEGIPDKDKFRLAMKLHQLLLVLVGDDVARLNHLLDHPDVMDRALTLIYELDVDAKR